jgi:hypothetical protein
MPTILPNRNPEATAVKRLSLPLWARLIIALVVASLVGVGYAAVRSVTLIKHLLHDSIDPKKQKQVVQSIASFPDPLPDGFLIDRAISVGIPGIEESSKEIVVLRRQPDNLSVQLFSNPAAANEDTIDARNYLDRAIEVSYPAAKIQAVKSKGQTTICGQEMAYIVGEFKDPQDQKFSGMIGCICVKEKHKTILLYAVEPPGTPFNLETVMGLLKSVKGF